MPQETCPVCNGTGLDPDNPDYPCPECQGEGVVQPYPKRDD